MNEATYPARSKPTNRHPLPSQCAFVFMTRVMPPNDPELQRRRPRGVPLATATARRRSQPRQGRNLCSMDVHQISKPRRGDSSRTMPLLRSLGIPFDHAATKMPRLRRCRLTTQNYSDGGHEARRWHPRWPAAVRPKESWPAHTSWHASSGRGWSAANPTTKPKPSTAPPPPSPPPQKPPPPSPLPKPETRPRITAS